MKPHEIAIVDQGDAEFGAVVDRLAEAMRLGITEVGRQQAQCDFAAFLVAGADSRASLAYIAVTAISRLVMLAEGGAPDA